MVTGYPTTSPVNASGPSFLDALGVTPGSSTATILGAVAVGVLGIALIAGGIYYFKNGGSVKGLVKKFEENKETIKKVTGSVADLLPLSEEQKKKIDTAIDNPSSVLPPQAQQILQVADKAKEYKEQIISALPMSADQKAKLSASVDALNESALKRFESTPAGSQIKSVISLISPPRVATASSPSVDKPQPVLTHEPAPAAAPAAEPTPSREATLVAVHINAEDLASVQAFLASKK
jgi:hypothetical protein